MNYLAQYGNFDTHIAIVLKPTLYAKCPKMSKNAIFEHFWTFRISYWFHRPKQYGYINFRIEPYNSYMGI